MICIPLVSLILVVVTGRTIPIEGGDIMFPHNKVLSAHSKEPSYAFSYEDIPFTVVDQFGERVNKENPKEWHTDSGLHSMTSINGDVSGESIDKKPKRVFVARMLNHKFVSCDKFDDQKMCTEFGDTLKQGDIVAANECKLITEKDTLYDGHYGECEFADQDDGSGGYPCGYLANANTLKAFRGDKLSQEFSYQCFKFLANEKKVDYAYVKNWGKCSGALSYAKGAYAAGFTWFKSKGFYDSQIPPEWIKIPDFNHGGMQTNIKFLYCLKDGRCPDASTLALLPKMTEADCHDFNINKITMFFKSDLAEQLSSNAKLLANMKLSAALRGGTHL